MLGLWDQKYDELGCLARELEQALSLAREQEQELAREQEQE